MHQGESNPLGLSKRQIPKLLHAVLKMCELGGTPGSLELCYEIPLPDVVLYARVRGTSSPSRSFRETVHLSVFLFASFPNAH